MIVGHLRVKIEEQAVLIEGIETLLHTHAYPELTSENGARRARACWVYGEFSAVLKNKEGMVDIAVKIYDCLQTEDLPIRVVAATSLYKLLRVKEVRDRLESGLSNIVESYLAVMKEIDQDELITALERVIDVYDDKVEPFAF